jgi:muramoyltetrapeptide carboxypeptidase
MVTKDFVHPDGIDLVSWEAATTGIAQWNLELGPDDGVKGLREGKCEGILYGGCLSMLVASLGTPHEIRTAGTILFIEDIATKPYQIDRMLMHLKLAGKLKEVRGIIFGEMVDCVQNNNQDYTLEEVILRVLDDVEIPIAYGLHSGHVTKGNITLPIGVRAALETTSSGVGLNILEPATIAAPIATRSPS